MLKTRKILKDNSNYTGIFGQGNANFISGAEALAQILTHQILTIRGELKTRVNFGVDWFTHKAVGNEKLQIDNQIRNVIINNPYVKSILAFESTFNPQTNMYNLSFKADTTEGLLSVNI